MVRQYLECSRFSGQMLYSKLREQSMLYISDIELIAAKFIMNEQELFDTIEPSWILRQCYDSELSPKLTKLRPLLGVLTFLQVGIC